MTHSFLGIALLLGLAAAAPAPPATAPGVSVDLSNSQVIELYDRGDPRLTPTTRPEIVLDENNRQGLRERKVRQISVPTITTFLPAATTRPTAAVIVIPGGAYAREWIDQTYFIGERLRQNGIAAFVLKYRLPSGNAVGAGELPLPIIDVFRAMRLVRSGASGFNIDPQRIGVMGLSAGGHLAGAAATEFNDLPPTADASAIDRTSARPDFAVLLYAVSSMHDALTHPGSRRWLLGTTPTPQAIDRFSTAQRITADTPPLLLIHAEDDSVVKVDNSVEVAAAAARNGVPCAAMLFRHGGHGFNLGLPHSEAETWFDAFLLWLHALPPPAEKHADASFHYLHAGI